jgi:hypothetical protein
MSAAVPSRIVFLTTATGSFQSTYPVAQIYINNPTRGNIYIRLGGNDFPTATNADFAIGPLTDRAFPVNSMTLFAWSMDYPNSSQPATMTLLPTSGGVAIGGIQANVIDPPLEVLNLTGVTGTPASEGDFTMVGRWVRIRWKVIQTSAPNASEQLGLVIIDTVTGEQFQIICPFDPGSYNFGPRYNFSDFLLQTGSAIRVLVRKVTANALTGAYSVLVTADFLDRPDYPWPQAVVQGNYAIEDDYTNVAQGTVLSAGTDGLGGCRIQRVYFDVTGATLPNNFYILIRDFSTAQQLALLSSAQADTTDPQSGALSTAPGTLILTTTYGVQNLGGLGEILYISTTRLLAFRDLDILAPHGFSYVASWHNGGTLTSLKLNFEFTRPA